MQGVLSANEAHLCVIDDANHVASICGHKWLQAPTGAAREITRCPECSRIDLSGDEIAALDVSGNKFTIRAKQAPAHIGSSDPFDDIVEKLKALRCCYILIIGMQSQARSLYWTNMLEYGPSGIDNFEITAQGAIKDARKKLSALESGEA